MTPTAPSPALRVSGLRAGYRDGGAMRVALDGLDLEIAPGRIYALLGPNGAGKTTLLRCLTGILRPGSGSMRLLGRDPGNAMPPDLLRRIGALLESPGGYGRMTVEEYLRFFA